MEGLDLKTASRILRQIASSHGITRGRWEPINSNKCINDMRDGEIVARIWNRNKEIKVTAGEIRVFTRNYFV